MKRPAVALSLVNHLWWAAMAWRKTTHTVERVDIQSGDKLWLINTATGMTLERKVIGVRHGTDTRIEWE
jgi:hypothetical protein